jgi:S1-C subfamily serine protease
MKGLKKQLKLKLTSLLKSCRGKSQLLMEVAAICCALGGVGLLAVKAPEIHSSWIRSKVGSKVYVVRGEHGQGTGFAIKAPSGQSYILTNDHICGVSKDGLNILVIGNDGEPLNRRIIARSQHTDLCLIEGMPGTSGLSLGSEPSIGQVVAAVGHPAGYALTMSRGEIIQREDVIMMQGPISFQNPESGQWELVPAEQGGILEKQCQLPKNETRIIDVDQFFFVVKVKFCLIVTREAMWTNMLIQPGSSGSPVVNFWGNVIGVAFAGDQAMWGIVVNRHDIIEFLRLY